LGHTVHSKRADFNLLMSTARKISEAQKLIDPTTQLQLDQLGDWFPNQSKTVFLMNSM